MTENDKTSLVGADHDNKNHFVRLALYTAAATEQICGTNAPIINQIINR